MLLIEIVGEQHSRGILRVVERYLCYGAGCPSSEAADVGMCRCIAGSWVPIAFHSDSGVLLVALLLRVHRCQHLLMRKAKQVGV